jgi:multidrug efflux pump subunit AcrA (membrane-fusion protein)
MKRAVIIIAILVAVGAAVAAGWWFVTQNPDWVLRAQAELDVAIAELGLVPEEEPEGLLASGFIEADEASVSTEMGGRIVALHADEGDEVAKGEVLVELDQSLLQAQIEMTGAEVDVAEAMLAQVKAGVRGETLDHAQSVVNQAKAMEEAARVAWKDAQAMLANPQDLELALIAARGQLAVLDQKVREARALANSAQVGRDLADELTRMVEEFEPTTIKFEIAPGVIYKKEIKRLPGHILPEARYEQGSATYLSWEAWTLLDQAEQARKGAQDHIAELSRQLANPHLLQSQVNSSRAQLDVAGATVDTAEAAMEGLTIGATPEQIAAFEAQVEVARAALQALEVQSDKYALAAPISGLVLERPVHVGELAAPGAPLMTLANLDKVTLTVFVPEDQLGRVQIGQPVSITVDAYPDRTFSGSVSFIASEAEFTPKNVQTREERVNMVFAVKIEVPNADHALKPGMPADAVLQDID